MLFNIHHGQVRIRVSGMVFRPLSPKSSLIMQNYDNGQKGARTQYVADKLGNIDVVDPRHIETMIGLGYPIYNGDRHSIRMDDLLYPNTKGEYWRRINQALGKELKI